MGHSEKYDLEERTARLAESTIEFIKKISLTPVNNNIISQLMRSCTSIGANYCEANGASSQKDFKNKISICKKEAKETKYWLRMLVKTNPETRSNALDLWQETQELTLIFSKIQSTLNKKINRL
jgi:four helix bundle protein